MLTTAAPGHRRQALVERYRQFLPITDATPRLTLGEGSTPLVHARRLGAAMRGAPPILGADASVESVAARLGW